MSVLTIEISTFDLFLNNNILTESLIFHRVFPKYTLSRIKNIYPIQKNEGMIRIFA